MTRVLRLLVIVGVSALIVIGTQFASRLLAASGGVLAPVPTATAAGASLPASTGLPDLAEVRLHYCHAGVTYTMLSMPSDASFAMSIEAVNMASTRIPVTGPGGTGSPAPSDLGSYVCAEAGTAGSRTLVLCHAPSPSHLTISVHSSAGSRLFSLPMQPCASGASAATGTKGPSLATASITPAP